MSLVINRGDSSGASALIATERLFLTEDKSEVVAEGDPRAAFLLAGAGSPVPAEYAHLVESKAADPVEDKSSEPGEDKQVDPPENKAADVPEKAPSKRPAKRSTMAQVV